jgi:hypothetical protein
MSEPSKTLVPSKIEIALQGLRGLKVAACGPFITPKNHRIYVIEGCILTESEIILFHEGGKFTAENIGPFLAEIRRLQSSQPRYLQYNQPDPQKQRRSQRVMLRLHVLVRLEIHEGSPLQTHAFTVVVNAHGGLLESPFRTTVGQRITLVNPQTGKEVRCKIVGVRKSPDGYFTTAFEFDGPNPQFWAVAFPPLDWNIAKEPV